jgi:hypothetical protein
MPQKPPAFGGAEQPQIPSLRAERSNLSIKYFELQADKLACAEIHKLPRFVRNDDTCRLANIGNIKPPYLYEWSF